jgi:beta-glucosidase
MSFRPVLLLLIVPLMAGSISSAQETQPAYRNPKLTVEERAADLLQRMTLEEKVDQLAFARRYAQASNPEEKQIFDELSKLWHEDAELSPHDAAQIRNKAQHFLVEKTRLGIPALFQGEALHGYMAYGSTSFPQVLGLASTWDPELVQQAFTAAADEMASSGTNQAFTPVLDLGRDPRWGRTEETYGEDPYLVSRMGVAAINGLQGPSWMIDRHHVLATMKHFAAHGQPESGTNTAPVNLSERELRETFPGSLRSRGQGSARGQRDGFVQRNRWHSFACESLAAGQGSAAGMGFPRIRDLGWRWIADAGQHASCRG